MKTPSMPAAPDPGATANQQAKANLNAATTQQQLNMVDQVTPYGNLTYTQSTQPGLNGKPIPKYTATTTLSPTEQANLDRQNLATKKLDELGISQIDKIGNILDKPLDIGSLGKLDMSTLPGLTQPNFGGLGEMPNTKAMGDIQTPGSLGNIRTPTSLGQVPNAPQSMGDIQKFNADTGAVESRLMELGSKRLDPMFEQRRNAAETRLANQGIYKGSEAYDREMRALGEQQNDAYNQLLLTGRNQAFNELNDIYGNDLAGRQQQFNEGQALFGNQMAGRQQQFNEGRGLFADELAARQQQFGEGQSLFGNQLTARQQQFNEGQSLFGNQMDTRQQRMNEMQTGFGNQLSTRQQMANELMTGRQQQLQEMLTARNQPINEITALMSGSQVQQPNFANTPTTQVAAPDVGGLTMDAYRYGPLAQYQAQQAQNQAMLGGLFGLGGAVGGGLARNGFKIG